MHHPDALSQGDARRWPAQDGCPVGRHRHLEVVHASDVLDNAVACVVPNVDAEGEADLGLHRGQSGPIGLARAPRYLYPMLLRRVLAGGAQWSGWPPGFRQLASSARFGSSFMFLVWTLPEDAIKS